MGEPRFPQPPPYKPVGSALSPNLGSPPMEPTGYKEGFGGTLVPP